MCALWRFMWFFFSTIHWKPCLSWSHEFVTRWRRRRRSRLQVHLDCVSLGRSRRTWMTSPCPSACGLKGKKKLYPAHFSNKSFLYIWVVPTKPPIIKVNKRKQLYSNIWLMLCLYQHRLATPLLVTDCSFSDGAQSKTPRRGLC